MVYKGISMLTNQNIQNNNYSIEYYNKHNTILLRGMLDVKTSESFDEIIAFIYNKAINKYKNVTFDLSRLEKINSSGITALCLLIIKIRDLDLPIKIIASKYSQWQSSALMDLKDLYDTIEIEYIVLH